LNSFKLFLKSLAPDFKLIFKTEDPEYWISSIKILKKILNQTRLGRIKKMFLKGLI
jgi:hypothetical protein